MAIERNQILVASYKVSIDLNFKMDLFLRPLLQHARPLPDRQPDPRPTFDFFREQLTSLVEIVAGVKQAVDLRAILGPLLDLVVITIVRELRVVGLFGRLGPKVWHCERLG